MNKNTRPGGRENLFYISLLAVLVFAANWRFLFTGGTYQALGGLNHDFEAIHFLVMNYLHEFYLKGYFPLWFPYYSFGQPGLASYLPALFLPNSVIFFSMFSYPASLKLFCVFNYLLTAIFSYLFFRRLKMSGFSAFFAAAWNTLAGYTLWISQFHHSIGFIPWFFLFMWAVTGIMKNSRMRTWLLGACAACLLILSGEPEALTYTLYFAGLWILIYGMSLRLNRKKWIQVLILCSAMAALACLVGALQVWPTLNFLSRTVRPMGLSPSAFAKTFVPLEQVLYPGVYIFSRQLKGLYLGIIPLLFALSGIFAVRKNPARTASIMVMLLVIVILAGSPLGLSHILYRIPLFSLFIRHFKLAFILQFSFIILCGLGLDYYLKRIPRPSRWLWVLLLLFGILNIVVLPGVMWRVISSLVLLGALATTYRGRPLFIFFVFLMAASDICSYLWHTPFRLEKPRYWPVYENLVKDMDARGRSQVSYPALAVSKLIWPYSVPVQVGGWDEGQSFDTWLSFPLNSTTEFFSAVEPRISALQQGGYAGYNFSTFLKSIDFITADNRHLINLANLRYIFCEDMALKEADRRPILSDPEYFLNYFNREGFKPYTRKLFSRHGDMIPVLAISRSGIFFYHSRFDPGSVLRFSVSLESEGQAEARFKLLWQPEDDEKLSEIFNHVMSLSRTGGRIESEITETPLDSQKSSEGTLIFQVEMDAEGTRAVWINPVLINHNKTLRWLAGEGRRMAFENIEALERCRIVHDVILAQNASEALNLMRDAGGYDPRKHILLLKNRYTWPGISEKPSGAPESAEIVEYHNEYIIVRAGLKRPGWLVVSDNYYPGWRAFVNGEEQRIYRADLTFRGIPLPQGQHEILFRFEPVDFRIGLWATIASLAALMVMPLLVCMLQRRRSSC